MPNFLKKVPVFNGDMTELSPTSSAKARILLESRKAKVICTHPFIIRLNYVKSAINKWEQKMFLDKHSPSGENKK